MKVVLLTLLLIAAVAKSASGTGRMMKPPNRSSLWRLPEFQSQNPPVNYNDNQLNCCGIPQIDHPGSNCGVCGDASSQATPRDNEHGGTYGRGIVAGRYMTGQIIEVEVDLTNAILGFMEWRLCTDRSNATQSCFNEHMLELASGDTRLPVDRGTGVYYTQLRLPPGVRCLNCVIQWNYRGGNNWPADGPQETFRGCADVVIS